MSEFFVNTNTADKFRISVYNFTGDFTESTNKRERTDRYNIMYIFQIICKH